DHIHDLTENAIEHANRDILRIRIANDILSVLSKIANGYSIDFDPDNIIIFLSLPKDDLQGAGEILNDIDENLSSLLKINVDFAITIGISNLYESLIYSYQAYKEA